MFLVIGKMTVLNSKMSKGLTKTEKSMPIFSVFVHFTCEIEQTHKSSNFDYVFASIFYSFSERGMV